MFHLGSLITLSMMKYWQLYIFMCQTGIDRFLNKVEGFFDIQAMRCNGSSIIDYETAGCYRVEWDCLNRPRSRSAICELTTKVGTSARWWWSTKEMVTKKPPTTAAGYTSPSTVGTLMSPFLIFFPFLSTLRDIRIHSTWTVSERIEEFLTLYTVLIRRV